MSGNSGKNWLYGGLITGVAAGLIYVAGNKKVRTKVTNTFESVTERTNEFLIFIRENREPFVDHIKASAERVAEIVEEASEDIQRIVETSQHLKEHTFDILGTIHEAKEEFEQLSSQLKHKTEREAERAVPDEDVISLEGGGEEERKQLPPSSEDNGERKDTV
ncbi:hypothetical protein CR205_14505 [Alteribacter lacisalsi]|uniref:YtxH domain-containing protein n=1 Tax=Alteribacter lacisalsi TaxID=2045244 RepID=A0A2W0HHH6_9BACI|nr:hypothetical protein [Alteribacter lacisalsi]PYZ96885.1 hypothetical protein CR205_14505 [Alteribacter lacisalsi]